MKTGTKVKIRLLKPAIKTIKHLNNYKEPLSNVQNSNLLTCLKCTHSFRSLNGYEEYQLALRRFNFHLKILGKRLGIKNDLSSYTLRHSWATTAKYTGASIEMISELLGHKSIKTTQIYLAGFNTTELAKVNKKVCNYIENMT